MAKVSLIVMWSQSELLVFFAGLTCSFAQVYVPSTSIKHIQSAFFGLFNPKCSIASCGSINSTTNTKISRLVCWPRTFQRA